MPRLILYILFMLLCQNLKAGHYLIYFKDKGDISNLTPSDCLSDKALKRRLRYHIPFSASDIPVSAMYLKEIKSTGALVIQCSKWLNAALVEATGNQMAAIQSMPFVLAAQKGKFIKTTTCEVTKQYATPFDTLTTTSNQLEMLGLDVLHASNFTGIGITITFMDGGYTAVDEVTAYKHLFNNNRIIATRNFVEPNKNVYKTGGEGEHGCRVFSITAAFQPNQFHGSAYNASFILAVTEDAFNESSAEELNWAAAAEWADSMGTDIINSSIGYFSGFTTGTGYTYADMNGKTTLVTQAAQIASSKGILVVASVGNEGNKAWKYLIAPADGDSVLAAGGVDALEIIGAFSSRGPSADGRIKPDLCARADNTIQIGSNGNIIWGLGTSFSAPLLSGLAACLWQADTSLTNMQLFSIMKQSADRYATPDNYYGYGIPNGAKAFELIKGYKLPTPKVKPGGIKLYPNPLSGNTCWLAFDNNTMENADLEMEISNNIGQVINHLFININTPRLKEHKIEISGIKQGQGIYYITIRNRQTGELLLRQKILISETF